MSSVLASAVPAEVRAEVRAEQHLSTDAVVAFVDGELRIPAHERATRHLARCPSCLAEVAAQRQARAAVRDADGPVMSSSLLAALHAIPQRAELPPGPDELAVTEDGQLVVVRRQRGPQPGRLGAGRPLGGSEPIGAGTRLGVTGFARPAGAAAPGVAGEPDPAGVGMDGVDRRRGGRRARQAGAGVVMSGLVLGALVLAAPSEPVGTETVPGTPRPSTAGGTGVVGESPAATELIQVELPQGEWSGADVPPVAGPGVGTGLTLR